MLGLFMKSQLHTMRLRAAFQMATAEPPVEAVKVAKALGTAFLPLEPGLKPHVAPFSVADFAGEPATRVPVSRASGSLKLSSGPRSLIGLGLGLGVQHHRVFAFMEQAWIQ